MEHPEQNHAQIDVNKMGDPSPMNAMWGMVLALLTFLLVLICVVSVRMISKEAGVPDDPVTPDDPTRQDDPTDPADPAEPMSFLMEKTEQTQSMQKYTQETGTGVYSEYAILVDLSNNTVLAELNGDDMIYPASMTKVMTLLVAAEHLQEHQYDAVVTMSADVISEMQRQNASGFGFQAGEKLTVRDLFYAIALESDCAASVQLAEYIAGSHEAFVDMMNQKCNELGLVRTSFTNATGLHHDNHYTTCREMATIMAAAVANETVCNVMSQKIYRSNTNIHGRVTFSSTFFVDVLENGGSYFKLPDGARVVAAKTGTTDEAGKCLVSCIESGTGERYVIVTANALTTNVYCSDYTSIYKNYVK